MESYLGVAKSENILTEEEIGAVQSIVMAVSAGKIGAQLSEVQAGMEKSSNSTIPTI